MVHPFLFQPLLLRSLVTEPIQDAEAEEIDDIVVVGATTSLLSVLVDEMRDGWMVPEIGDSESSLTGWVHQSVVASVGIENRQTS